MHPALKNKITIDVHDRKLPKEVHDALMEYCKNFEYSNGSYHEWYTGEEEEDHPIIAKFLEENGLKDSEDVLFLFWW